MGPEPRRAEPGNLSSTAVVDAVLVQTVERPEYPAITAGMTEPTSAQDLFKGRHFDQEIIILCVRWYITFKLSFRDLVQMMAERGITLSHTTILRWVQQYVPEFEKRWNHYARPVGDSWRVDETYIKVKGQWVYLYRAVDRQVEPSIFSGANGVTLQPPSG